MPRSRLLIFGSGGHAKVCIDIARLAGFEVVGLLDDEPSRTGQHILEVEVLGGREYLAQLDGGSVGQAFCAVGENTARLEICTVMESSRLTLPALIHPRAIVADAVDVGAGTLIAAGAAVNPGARLGRACIVNTNASVDHDNDLDDGVHVSPGAHLGGGVRVGARSHIGIGASVLPNVRIGADVIVGGGALVNRNVPDGAKVVGVPARPL